MQWFSTAPRNSVWTLLSLAMVMTCFAPSASANGQIRITIENLQAVDGFYLTPVWTGFHDGAFDVFTSGQSAGGFPGLEVIAEEGDTGPISTEFNMVAGRHDLTILAPAGFGGAPVFDPGEIVVEFIDVPNPSTNRYLSYASMVIPSNDAFFANADPMALEIFDNLGNFNGPVTIDILGGDIFDAGTEVNDMMGAPFSMIGGISTDDNGLIGPHPGLNGFLGTQTAALTILGSALNTDTPLARITITAVPEPSTLALTIMGLLAVTGMTIRRRSGSRRSRHNEGRS